MPEKREEGAKRDARAAGLRYSSDEEPGITRVRRGKGFAYYGPGRELVTAKDVRARCDALAIPPAYEQVWICMDAKGHLQATARDARARKTYRYHDDWRAFRDEAKFAGLAAFGRKLGTARRRNDEARKTDRLRKGRLLAAVFHLLDAHALRIGNEAYAARNDSYGATTLRQNHVSGDTVHFTSKGGREVEIEIEDARFERLVRRLHDLPGQSLFQYRDEEGDLQRLTSTDVNAYLRRLFGEDVTAKQFRTWAGSVAAFEAAAHGDATVKEVVGAAARRLRNTRAVARKSYVHPAIVEAVKRGDPPASFGIDEAAASDGLSPSEAAFLEWIEARD